MATRMPCYKQAFTCVDQTTVDAHHDPEVLAKYDISHLCRLVTPGGPGTLVGIAEPHYYVVLDANENTGQVTGYALGGLNSYKSARVEKRRLCEDCPQKPLRIEGNSYGIALDVFKGSRALVPLMNALVLAGRVYSPPGATGSRLTVDEMKAQIARIVAQNAERESQEPQDAPGWDSVSHGETASGTWSSHRDPWDRSVVVPSSTLGTDFATAATSSTLRTEDQPRTTIVRATQSSESPLTRVAPRVHARPTAPLVDSPFPSERRNVEASPSAMARLADARDKIESLVDFIDVNPRLSAADAFSTSDVSQFFAATGVHLYHGMVAEADDALSTLALSDVNFHAFEDANSPSETRKVLSRSCKTFLDWCKHKLITRSARSELLKLIQRDGDVALVLSHDRFWPVMRKREALWFLCTHPQLALRTDVAWVVVGRSLQVDAMFDWEGNPVPVIVTEPLPVLLCPRTPMQPPETPISDGDVAHVLSVIEKADPLQVYELMELYHNDVNSVIYHLSTTDW